MYANSLNYFVMNLLIGNERATLNIPIQEHSLISVCSTIQSIVVCIKLPSKNVQHHLYKQF